MTRLITTLIAVAVGAVVATNASAQSAKDVLGATPTTFAEGPFNFDVTIPTPVPSIGVPLQLPSTPGTAGPFTGGQFSSSAICRTDLEPRRSRPMRIHAAT